jgi:hypothetical protein
MSRFKTVSATSVTANMEQNEIYLRSISVDPIALKKSSIKKVDEGNFRGIGRDQAIVEIEQNLQYKPTNLSFKKSMKRSDAIDVLVAIRMIKFRQIGIPIKPIPESNIVTYDDLKEVVSSSQFLNPSLSNVQLEDCETERINIGYIGPSTGLGMLHNASFLNSQSLLHVSDTQINSLAFSDI